MTKSELYTLLQEYLENEETSFSTNRDLFVRLAEEDIFRQVQLPDLRKNSTSTFTASSPYLGTPSDYLAPYSMAVVVSGTYTFLVSKDVSFIREAFPSPTTTGTPRFFAQFDDDSFIIGPTPASNYTVELHYFYKPESLSEMDDDDETWLSANAENALLFGALMHGYIYMKGDQDVIAGYTSQFQKAIADLKIIAEGRVKKDSYRQSDKRIPV